MGSFEKLLTETDIKRKLSVPCAFLGHINGGDGGQLLVMDDQSGRIYSFIVSTGPGKHKKPVFQSKGWLKFVKDNGLQAGDTIYFSKNQNGLFRIGAMFNFWAR